MSASSNVPPVRPSTVNASVLLVGVVRPLLSIMMLPLPLATLNLVNALSEIPRVV